LGAGRDIGTCPFYSHSRLRRGVWL
jgi:hypothetical protein